MKFAAAPTQAAPASAFELDEERHRIRYHGQALELSRYEYGILRLLLKKPGRVYTREQLLDADVEQPRRRGWRIVQAAAVRRVDTDRGTACPRKAA